MKKKRLGIFLLLIIGIAIVFIPLGGQAYAEEATTEEENEDAATEENLHKIVDEALNGIDFSGYDALLNELESRSGESFGTTVLKMLKDVLSGENQYDFAYFFQAVVRLITGELISTLPMLGMIALIAILYGILSTMTANFSKSSTQKIVYVACYGAIITILAYMVSDTIVRTKETIDFLDRFIDIVFPILITLITALGGSATVAIYQPLVLVYSTIIFKVINLVVFPLFYITLVFGIVGNLSDNVKLGKFAKTTKSIAEWVLGLTFSIFITIITAQGITGASFDSLAAKGAKYALSSYVPIVGNHLKEGFDIILAGVVVVKNAVGLVSVIILLLTVIYPIVKLLIMSFALRLTAGLLESVTDKKISEMIYSTSKAMTLLIVIIVCVAFSLIIILTLILYTCNFGVL